jgi:hypothetical protein
LKVPLKAILAAVALIMLIAVIVMQWPPETPVKISTPMPPKVSLSWEPARVISGKIYDVKVYVSVKGADQLKWLRVKLIPVEYSYFIENYGMRREDYLIAFPQESVRSIDIQLPGEESFSVKFTDLAGGKEYIILAEGEDLAGRSIREELKTPYIRQFENVAKQDEVLIGAYYYPWYSPSRHWQEGHMSTPLLGLYDSRDPLVISKHIDWATGHGIDFLVMSWWGPGSFEDSTIRECFLKNTLISDVKIAILYESLGRLKVKNGEINVEENELTLLSDLDYLIKTYFNSAYYLRINDKPAMVIYLSRILKGNLSLGGLRDKVYLIGDLVYWQDPKLEGRIGNYDAVTPYNMHTSVQDILDNFEYNVDKKFGEWCSLCSEVDKGFIPSALPGFDDRAVRTGNIPLPRGLDRFRRQLEIARSHAKDNIVIIATFNEWHEDTQVEPSREDGMRYLQELSSYLGPQRKH